MAPVIVDGQPFRFLDLPKDIRLCVYDKIDFSTRHVLDRSQAIPGNCYWPAPPEDQVGESRIILIKPDNGFAIDILATCHLIYQEANQILKRKFEHRRSQPVRYIVYFNAAVALLHSDSSLRSCLGLPDGNFSRDETETVQHFLRTCALNLSRTCPIQGGTETGSECLRPIEVMMIHQSGVAYEPNVNIAIACLNQMGYCTRIRLVVIYKSPLPAKQIYDEDQQKLRDIELLVHVPREPEISNHVGLHPGVFVRPLEEAAFERHLKSLDYY